MAGVAVNGSTIAEKTLSDHITYKKYEYQYTTPIITDGDGHPIGGGVLIYEWVEYKTDATVNGTCIASSNGVFVNSKSAVTLGNTTTENDTYTIPSEGVYVSGAHTNMPGTVNNGNGKNVFIGGKSVSINGSTVVTHAGDSTTINQGSSNVFIGG